MDIELFNLEMRINKIQMWILSSPDWLKTQDLLSLPAFNSIPNNQLDEWSRDKRIFGVMHEGIQYYPVSAFDTACTVCPASGLHAILEEFAGKKMNGVLCFGSRGGATDSLLESTRWICSKIIQHLF